MSKSLNNFFLAKDVLEEYSGDALRYFLLSVQYRNPLDYSRDRLDEAEKNMERLSGVIGRLKELAAKEGAEKTDASRSLEKAAEESLKAFHEAMDDDFNTGLATGAMFDLAKAINIYGTAVDGGLSVDHEAVEKPSEPVADPEQPQAGDTSGNQIYVPGFGWVENHGGGGSGTAAEDMYENGNKIGIMD